MILVDGRPEGTRLISEQHMKILDKFAPFGCGIGILLLPICVLTFPHDYSIWPALIFPFMPYLLCTCTHRKYLLFSSTALLGSIAGWSGFFIGGIISVPIQMIGYVRNPSDWFFAESGWILGGIFGFIFAFFVSRWRCNSLWKKGKH